MKVSELFSGFLEAEDLPDGKDIDVVIESVRRAGKDDKGKDGRAMENPIVSLAKVKKEWVLNKTNARAIRRLYGNETDDWAGKPVTIYRTTCAAFGDPNTPCIRVRGRKL
jgi:hypothetical protein